MKKLFKRTFAILICAVMVFGAAPMQGVDFVTKASAASFTPRLTEPSYTTYYAPQSSYNPFAVNYNAYGGNCTWYAWGRAYEILGSRPSLSRGNAGEWWGYNRNGGYYSYGSTPRLGAIACWSNSGAGHVAVVEQINSDGTITISESGWSSCFFRTVKLPSSGARSGLTFQGFIYLGDFSIYTQIPDAVTNLRSEKHVYNSSESINFVWDTAARTQNYWIYLWKDGVSLYSYNCGLNTSFTSAPISSGNYTLVIRPGNNIGFNENSTSYSFIVTDSVPSAVTNLRSDKNLYSSSESINFSWDSAYGTQNYWIYLWKDGTNLYSYDCGINTSFTSAPISGGNYTMVIRPGNVNGFNEGSQSYSFIVYDTAPKGLSIFTDKTNYAIGETVNFSFNSQYAVELYIPIDVNGTREHLLNVTDKTTYSCAFNKAGTYLYCLYAKNSYGENSIEYKTFYVYDPNQTYTLTYNANGGSGAPGNQTKTHGEALTLSPTVPVRDGYTFLGWSESASAATATYQPGGSYTQDKSTTFYAVWQKNAATLSGISIKTLPNKTVYTASDALNTTGLTLTASYSDGSAQTVSGGFSCSPTALNTAGTRTITVTYSGKSATFTVTVNAAPGAMNYDGGAQTVKYGKSCRIGEQAYNGKAVVEWKSSNTGVGVIDQSGSFTPKNSGTVKITATLENGDTVTYTVTVTMTFIQRLVRFFKSLFGSNAIMAVIE